MTIVVLIVAPPGASMEVFARGRSLHVAFIYNGFGKLLGFVGCSGSLFAVLLYGFKDFRFSVRQYNTS